MSSNIGVTLFEAPLHCYGMLPVLVTFRGTTMASRADGLPLDDPATTEAWLRSFAARSRSKKLEDTNEEKQVTDLFLSKAGFLPLPVRKVSLMAQPNELESMNFNEIKDLILHNVRPKKKLVIAERIRFMSTRQDPKESAQSFAQRLRDASRFCEFNQLNKNGCYQSGEDELIQTAHNNAIRSWRTFKALSYLFR